MLVLLGFPTTDFIITITLSSSDAAVHIADNPFMPEGLRDHVILLTVVLVAVLGVVFLSGFREAINTAVVVVGVYLLLNLVVVGVGLYEVVTQPQLLA